MTEQSYIAPDPWDDPISHGNPPPVLASDADRRMERIEQRLAAQEKLLEGVMSDIRLWRSQRSLRR